MSFSWTPDSIGCTVWLTGLSGSGKTTIARNTKNFLDKFNIPSVHLDGDTLRKGLNADLGFTREDRRENVRRVGEVALLHSQAGLITLVSLIAPYAEHRLAARQAHENAKTKFFEVYVNTPIEICEVRDPKQLYRLARQGEIPNFTGVSTDAPYEPPGCPDLLIESGIFTIEDCTNKVFRLLVEHQIIPSAVLDPVDRHLPITQKIDLSEAAKLLPKIDLNDISLQWAQVIAEGWATPLEGFMKEKEFLECLHFKTLKVNSMIHSQSIPIVLPITEAEKQSIRGIGSASLCHNGKMIGIISDLDVFEDRKVERCARTFGSVDAGHPAIRLVLESKTDWLLGGKIQLLERIEWNDGLDRYRLTPQEIKHQCVQKKADAVFVFQVRNPLHNGHILLINETFEKLQVQGYERPVLLLHPIGGWTKDDDVPLSVRIEQHQLLLDEGILDKNKTILSIFPSPMSYAGPSEVQWHAKARLVAGIDFYIVGRDPAGTKDPSNHDRDLYEPTHGSKILEITPGLQTVKIIPFRVAGLNKIRNRMEFIDENSIKEEFENISGSKMRQMAREGEQPPDVFMHPKAWQVISKHYQNI